jgi:hypothetical protein
VRFRIERMTVRVCVGTVLWLEEPTVASTAMNRGSSRSHDICTIYVESKVNVYVYCE